MVRPVIKEPGLLAASMTALILLLVACGGQKSTREVLSSASFLPEKIDSLHIERSSEIQTFEGEALFEHINGGAEIYHQYAFIEVATAYYLRGETEISVDIYRFASEDNAYGLYTTIRPDNPAIVQLGVEGFATETTMDFVKGMYVVKLTGFEESPETASAIIDLARVVDGLIPGTTNRPGAFSLFPPDNRTVASDRIHAESFLGQSSLNTVYSQGYEMDSDTLILFLTEDPSGDKFQQWAEQAVTGEAVLEMSKDLPYDDKVLMIDDTYYGRIIAGTKGNLLLGMVNYDDKHRDFLIAWLATLP